MIIIQNWFHFKNNHSQDYFYSVDPQIFQIPSTSFNFVTVDDFPNHHIHAHPSTDMSSPQLPSSPGPPSMPRTEGGGFPYSCSLQIPLIGSSPGVHEQLIQLLPISALHQEELHLQLAGQAWENWNSGVSSCNGYPSKMITPRGVALMKEGTRKGKDTEKRL